VEFSSTDAMQLQEMEEDLTVMGHLLDQAIERGLGEQAPQSKMGVQMLYTSSKGMARSVYLEGFGALFMLKVNIPLLAPPPVTHPTAPKNADSEWESARREVLGEGGNDGIASAGESDTAFDATQVETLKQVLLNALKNASNIRHLKPDDYVSVAVFGQPIAQVGTGPVAMFGVAKAGTRSGSATKAKGPEAGAQHSNHGATSNAAVINAPRGTVLALRAKSADINAFAEGKSSADQFARQVTVNTYAGPGYGVTSVNSWIMTGRTPSTAVPY
jgi:hypothetical protein